MTRGKPSTTDFGSIVDWLEGRLGSDEAARLEQLLEAGDPQVAATVTWWQRFHAAVKMPTEPISDRLATRLVMMGPTAAAQSPIDRSSWLNRFVGAVQATLSFDSLRAPGLAMARSSSDATRQLVFSGPGLDIALDLSDLRDTELTANAQLLPLDDHTDASNVLVQAWSRFGMASQERSDVLGRVELGVLPADVVVLAVDATPAWPAVQAEIDLRQA